MEQTLDNTLPLSQSDSIALLYGKPLDKVPAGLYIPPDALKVFLESFEGPLDLLLALIAKNKIDITDIPIALIFDQYMEYISAAQALDMELAGEFIIMASRLMLIKSRMLLPREEKEEEDPRAALAAALLEYSRIKGVSEMLGSYYEAHGGRIAKDPETLPEDKSYVADDSIARLERAFRSVLTGRFRSERTPAAKPEAMLGTLLRRGGKKIPVSVRIYGIMRRLYRRGDCSFRELLLAGEDKAEMITTVVAVLELIRSQRVRISDESEEDLTLHLSEQTA